jgi:hypothetical protein
VRSKENWAVDHVPNSMIDLLMKYAGFIYGVIVAVVGWFALNMIGRPVLALREKRLRALQVADRYAYFGPNSSDERVGEVRRELLDIASELRAQIRGHNLLVRCYCWLLQYDMEEAALALRGLAEMAGSNYPEEVRTNNLNHVHISLRAHHHLTPEVLRRHQELVARVSHEVHSEETPDGLSGPRS